MRLSFSWTLGLAIAVVVTASSASAQCAGYAEPATTYTATNECSQSSTALQWTLIISCRDMCGEEWTSFTQSGTASSDCSSVPPAHYCGPTWKRLNHKNGRYAETSAYHGAYAWWKGCYQGPETVTAGTCPCAPPCTSPEEPVPPPDQCGGQPASSSTSLVISGAAIADAPALPSGFFSNRRETVAGMKYVMEDWALVRLDRTEVRPSRWELLGTSSLVPENVPIMRSARREQTRWSAESEGSTLALVIERPIHPDNSRMIPRPTVELQPTAIHYLGGLATATVRIDVGHDRTIRDIQILHRSVGLPAGLDLSNLLAENLQIGYASEKKHRIIVYGVVELATGAARLRDSLVVVPLCCCNPRCV